MLGIANEKFSEAATGAGRSALCWPSRPRAGVASMTGGGSGRCASSRHQRRARFCARGGPRRPLPSIMRCPQRCLRFGWTSSRCLLLAEVFAMAIPNSVVQWSRSSDQTRTAAPSHPTATLLPSGGQMLAEVTPMLDSRHGRSGHIASPALASVSTPAHRQQRHAAPAGPRPGSSAPSPQAPLAAAGPPRTRGLAQAPPASRSRLPAARG